MLIVFIFIILDTYNKIKLDCYNVQIIMKLIKYIQIIKNITPIFLILLLVFFSLYYLILF